MTPRHAASLPPSYFDARIRALESREASQSKDLAQTRAQLEWWRNGRALFVHDESGGSYVQQEADPDSRVTELVPPDDVLNAAGTKPTVRQSIVAVMRSRPPIDAEEQPWRSQEVINEIERRGWMRTGKTAPNQVRRMMRKLAEDEHGPLVKLDYGTFALSPSARNGEIATGSDL